MGVGVGESDASLGSTRPRLSLNEMVRYNGSIRRSSSCRQRVTPSDGSAQGDTMLLRRDWWHRVCMRHQAIWLSLNEMVRYNGSIRRSSSCKTREGSAQGDLIGFGDGDGELSYAASSHLALLEREGPVQRLDQAIQQLQST
jgi:hypothetical protein